jgi:cyanophycinase-like exopeptidase
MANDAHLSVGSVTLIGSGEMSPGMSKIHRSLMSAIKDPLKPVFIDTPAGFQPNVRQISEKAVQYFKKHFGVNLTIASFRSASEASEEETRRALAALKDANYIFAGPGSPTYAVRNWENSLIIKAIRSRLSQGAHLVFASAASIAIGAFALPVYEIYKVGDSPRWANGLNFLEPFGYEPVIMPHWDNKEGGAHDTRFCYMGEARFKRLEDQLPDDACIIGIDEYTALKMDLSQKQGMVMGAGKVTLKRRNTEIHFSAGELFDLTYLEKNGGRISIHNPEGTARSSLNSSDSPFPESPEPADGSSIEIPRPVVDFLVQIRSQARKEGKWGLADEIRDKLTGWGVILRDGPSETTWEKG